ncbi:MAG: LAGLIDADG family homing endonuclease [Nanoarchaeota archaeon]
MIGFRLGDLKVKATNKNSTVLISSNTTKIAQYKLIKRIYGKYGHFKAKDYNGVYHVYCNLDKSFNFLINKEDKIPEWILYNKNFFLAFLGGYTDAEGNIGISQNRARFRIRTYDKNILFQVHKNLGKLGINSKFGIVSRQGFYGMIRQNKDCFGVFVNHKEDLLKLLKFLKPYIRHKKRYKDLITAEKNILERNKKQSTNFKI